MFPRLTPLALVLALACASAAHAQLFKWVDERGVTNYSNEAPRNSSAQRVAPVQDRVSTYSNDPAPAASASTGASRPDPMRERLEALERQLELERRQRALGTEDEAERRKRTYDECVRARGVDCDRLGELPAGIAPAVVYVPTRRARIVPTLPVRERDARPRREPVASIPR